MSGTALDLSQIRTDALASAAAFRTLIGLDSILNGKEPTITAGTSAQYRRGDKTWQTLNQAAIAGLTVSDSPTFGSHIELSSSLAASTGLTALSRFGASTMIWANASYVVYKDGLELLVASSKAIGFSPSGFTDGITHLAGDAVWRRGGPGIISQRNGANPQEYRLNEQWTSDANQSYLSIRAQTGGDFIIAPVAVGATQRTLRLGGEGVLVDGYLQSTGTLFVESQNGVRITNRCYLIAPSNNLLEVRTPSTVGLADLKCKSFALWAVSPPASQPAAIADATDAATTQSALNSLLAAARSYGLIAV